ncbi:MAG: ATP-dependent Clp protease ATP-binding subunit ClpX, partial [candidate division Zixibacteria bacterium]|nr:ATP-dependent Clp protease ATP-binding subunit ClpX [candidate division Zixibacteria bacterium]
ALVKQYARLFAMEDVKLTFQKEALWEAVDIAEKKKTGARALRSILEKALLGLMFETPSKEDVEEIIVTPDIIKRTGDAEIVKKSAKKTG